MANGLHLMLPSEADTLSMNAVRSGLTALPTRTVTFIGAHSISVQAWTRNCGDGLARAARSVTSILEALPIIYQALQADNTMSWPAAGSCSSGENSGHLSSMICYARFRKRKWFALKTGHDHDETLLDNAVGISFRLQSRPRGTGQRENSRIVVRRHYQQRLQRR